MKRSYKVQYIIDTYKYIYIYIGILCIYIYMYIQYMYVYVLHACRHLRKASGLSDSISTQRCSQRPRANGAVKMPQSWQSRSVKSLTPKGTARRIQKDDFKSNSSRPLSLDLCIVDHSCGKGEVYIYIYLYTYTIKSFQALEFRTPRNSNSLASLLWDRVLPIHITNGQEFQGMFRRNFQFLFGFICQSWICKSLTPRPKVHDPMAPLMLLIDVGSCWFIWNEFIVLVLVENRRFDHLFRFKSSRNECWLLWRFVLRRSSDGVYFGNHNLYSILIPEHRPGVTRIRPINK